MLLAPTPPLSGSILSISNGTRGTWQTVRTMRALVSQGKVDPVILQAATSAVFNMREFDDLGEVNAVFMLVRDGIRYQRDINGVETLAYPATTLARQVGDCDDQSTLLGALLESVGYPTRFVVAGYGGPDYEHVYLQVLVHGQWIDADPTQHNELGWAPPYPTIYAVETV
jgi:transglutaminase-like putative cysteine protease